VGGYFNDKVISVVACTCVLVVEKWAQCGCIAGGWDVGLRGKINKDKENERNIDPSVCGLSNSGIELSFAMKGKSLKRQTPRIYFCTYYMYSVYKATT
jgi:hypothetical protein